MQKLLTITGRYIRKGIDFFYPLFRKYVGLQFFRYGVCGVGNLVFDLLLYFVVYNFVIRKQFISLGFVTISPHIASLLITFPITLLTGFLLQKYVTFSASDLRGRSQLARYISVVVLNLMINYFGLKLLVEVAGLYPTPSKLIIMIITVAVSYFLQKNFTFKTK